MFRSIYIFSGKLTHNLCDNSERKYMTNLVTYKHPCQQNNNLLSELLPTNNFIDIYIQIKQYIDGYLKRTKFKNRYIADRNRKLKYKKKKSLIKTEIHK